MLGNHESSHPSDGPYYNTSLADVHPGGKKAKVRRKQNKKKGRDIEKQKKADKIKKQK